MYELITHHLSNLRSQFIITQLASGHRRPQPQCGDFGNYMRPNMENDVQ